MQQTLDDHIPDIYGVSDDVLPGVWRWRMDRIWHNTDTDELVVIRPGPMTPVEGDECRVNIHRDGRVDTVLDNISLDRARTVAARYIWRGDVPEDSWLADV